MVAREDPDILCVTESWLSNQIDSATLGLKSFSIFRNDRNSATDPHGGVFLAIKSHLNPFLEKNSEIHELIIASFFSSNEKIKIVGAYRTPALNSNENENFVNFLRDNLNDCPSFILLGDLNCPNIDWENYVTQSRDENVFLSFVNENSLN